MTLLVNAASQPRELISTALAWLADGRRIALATLTHIEGNAPYPVGSQMLVDDAGEYCGQITGGCAESAIADQAVVTIGRGQNQRHRYGLDSPFFDIQLPCGSGIDVYFDCEIGLADLTTIQQQLDLRKPVTRTIDAITKTYYPTARLLLFGQGPILTSLAKQAIGVGFDVVCFAQNTDTQTRLANGGLAAMPLQTRTDITGSADAYSAVISLFHEHELEVPILRSALNSPAFYIGALGSKRTHSARLKSLLGVGVSAEALPRIHGPVGLDIGADTPGQIAIAILADVIRVMNTPSL